MDRKMMSEEALSTKRGVSSEDDLELAGPDCETIPNHERDLELARAVASPRLVWRNRQFIFRLTLAGLVLSTVIVFLIPKRFQSTGRLMPPDQGNSSLALLAAAGGRMGGSSGGLGSNLGSSGLGAIAGDLLGLKNTSDLFIGILQSQTVKDDLINKFDLRKVYSDRKIEDAREDLSDHTQLSADRKSGIITIQVVDRSPKRAAAMVGEYISELNWVVTQLSTSSAHRERVFLEDRLTQVKQDLESAEARFSEFATRNTALDIPNQAKAMIEAVATLQGELIASETELESLRQIYADGNVRVRAAQARVDELRRQLSKNMGSKSGGPSTANGEDVDSAFPSIRELPTLGVGYADLYRNTRVQEAIFQVLTEEYELAKVQEAKETPSVKVLDPPDVPEKRHFPPRLLFVLLGTVLSLAASVVWIFGSEAWHKIAVSDPRKAFANEVFLTVSASVPFIPKNGSGNHSVNGGAVNGGGRHATRLGQNDRSLDASDDDSSDAK